MLLIPHPPSEGTDALGGKLPAVNKGHSIMEEDAKDAMTEQQVEFVRLHQH